MQEPMHTWSTLVPFRLFTVTTWSGMWGQAIRGSRLERSISITRSYSASASGCSSRKSFSRPWALRKARVISSEGKMELVAPSSAPMLVMVARSGTVRVFAPSPPHSIIFPTPPFTESMRSISRLISLAVTKGRRAPLSSTFITLGIVI